MLHDQLLALFEKHPDLKPHDVVVMAPDISIYAPFAEAVLATAPEAERIPFSIADRGARAENGVIDTFLRILELAGSRFTASSVMSILESVGTATPLRSGRARPRDYPYLDRENRDPLGHRCCASRPLGLPEFGENSWRAGLDRLLLGYAAPARDERLFEGILAFDEVEGNLAETLGHFADFAECAFRAPRAGCKQPRPLAEWEEALREMAVRFFVADDEREPELWQLRRVLDSLGETATCQVSTNRCRSTSSSPISNRRSQARRNGCGFLVGRAYLLRAQADASGAVSRRLSRRDERHCLSAP